MRLALKLVMQSDRDFADVILLYCSVIMILNILKLKIFCLMLRATYARNISLFP